MLAFVPQVLHSKDRNPRVSGMDLEIEYKRKLREVKRLLTKNRPLWGRMDRAGVASYRYAVKLTTDQIKEPSVSTLVAIERFLKGNVAA